MHIRPTVRADVPSVADVFAAACTSSPVYSYLTPYRNEYPDAYRASAVSRAHGHLLNPNMYGMVCVTDTQDTDLRDANGNLALEGTIIGYSWWSRSSRRARDVLPLKRDSWFESLERTLRKAENWYTEKFTPNPAFDPTAVAEYGRIGAAEGAKNREFLMGKVPYWVLGGLGVHPHFQGRGAAKMLVQWGLDETMADWEGASEVEREGNEVGCVATLIAVPAGQGLYLKMGFMRVGNQDGPYGVRLPGGMQDDWYMIWDPLRLWSREIERDGEKYLIYK